jgi:diacylglycerol kinase
MRNELAGLIKSFKHAFNGISFTLKGRSIRIQLIVALLVLVMGIYFSLSMIEWLVIITVIFTVLVVETLNTAIEEVCNDLKDLPEIQPGVTKRARDIAAGSSLLISICALVIGILVFLPKIINLIS